MSAAATASRPATEKRRFLRLLEVLGTWVLEIDIHTGKRVQRVEQSAYILECLSAPEGTRALVRLSKLGEDRGTTYDVLCAAAPEGDSCDCPGATYRPGTRCRHVDAVRALVESGRLPS